jgi:dipeptidyl aminopeptidase/acylaminoacyl peptidase
MNSLSMNNIIFKFVGKTGFVILAAFIAQPLPARAQKRPITVADMIEMRAIVTSYDHPILLSPDGRHYLIVFQSGDLQRNGSWIEFWSGETTFLAAAKPIQIAKLFTSSTVRANDLVKDLRWLGNNQVAFLWEDGVHPSNLKVLNIRTHRLRTLAERSTSIVEYSISEDGNELAYTTRRPHRAQTAQPQYDGVVIGDESIWSLLDNRDKEKTGDPDQYETFVVAPPVAKPRKVDEPPTTWFTRPELLSLSPVGRYAVAVRPAVRILEGWEAYTDHIFKDIYLPSARNGSGQGNWIRQYELIDVDTATAQPLWDAPINPIGKVVWSPDGKSIVVGPTFLPVSGADTVGLAGKAVAIIDVYDGSFTELPLPNHGSGHEYTPVAWSRDGTVTLETTEGESAKPEHLNFRKTSEGWQAVNEQANDDPKTKGAIRIVVRQGLNTPPALFAIDARTQEEKKLLEINPALQERLELGGVEAFHWKAGDGRHWTGILYHPVDFQSGKRYPLVIQTHGYSPTEFSLAGSHLTTVFAAQPLAAAGIMVLQLGGPDEDISSLEATPREPEMAVAGFESAIEQLVSDGMVDSKRIGIIGFSRTGWYVEYALTHSSFDFAAAIVADNMDGGYLQYVFGGPSQRAELEKDAGGRPLGDGLQAWFRNAPGFLADRVRCPLRFELDSGPASDIILEWELFSHLRYLQKPAELFLIPDIEHGVHVLQNPAQRMASEGGAVDWFRFWLKGEEAAGKEAQYRRWRKLRSLSEVGSQPTAQ